MVGFSFYGNPASAKGKERKYFQERKHQPLPPWPHPEEGWENNFIVAAVEAKDVLRVRQESPVGVQIFSRQWEEVGGCRPPDN